MDTGHGSIGQSGPTVTFPDIFPGGCKTVAALSASAGHGAKSQNGGTRPTEEPSGHSLASRVQGISPADAKETSCATNAVGRIPLATMKRNIVGFGGNFLARLVIIWRVVVDGRRTPHLQEIQLLVKTTIRKGRRGFVCLGHPLPNSLTLAKHLLYLTSLRESVFGQFSILLPKS